MERKCDRATEKKCDSEDTASCSCRTDAPSHSRTSPLAHFLGPKSENAPLFEELLLEITRDYLHWRRNYFPGDPILISRSLQRELVPQNDQLLQHLHTMLA